MTIKELDSGAMAAAEGMKRGEATLLPFLMGLYEKRGFIELGYTGIFDYVTRRLKLSEGQASHYKNVAEKARQVPALKAAVAEGKISLSQARRIVPVLNPKNADEMIAKAQTLKQKELERAVSEINPNAHPRARSSRRQRALGATRGYFAGARSQAQARTGSARI